MSLRIEIRFASDNRFKRPCICGRSCERSFDSARSFLRSDGGMYFPSFVVLDPLMGATYGFSRVFVGGNVFEGFSSSSSNETKSSSSSIPDCSSTSPPSSSNSSYLLSLSVFSPSELPLLPESSAANLLSCAFCLLFSKYSSPSVLFLLPGRRPTASSMPSSKLSSPSSSNDFGSFFPITPSAFSKAAISASSSASLSLTPREFLAGGSGGGERSSLHASLADIVDFGAFKIDFRALGWTDVALVCDGGTKIGDLGRSSS